MKPELGSFWFYRGKKQRALQKFQNPTATSIFWGFSTKKETVLIERSIREMGKAVEVEKKKARKSEDLERRKKNLKTVEKDEDPEFGHVIFLKGKGHLCPFMLIYWWKRIGIEILYVL